jgi:hypothetical protein
MSADDDDINPLDDDDVEQTESQLAELPDPPEPRKSMELRAPDANMPDPPPPMLSSEEAPDDEPA